MIRNKSFPALLCSKSQESCVLCRWRWFLVRTSYYAYNTGVTGNATTNLANDFKIGFDFGIWTIFPRYDYSSYHTNLVRLMQFRYLYVLLLSCFSSLHLDYLSFCVLRPFIGTSLPSQYLMMCLLKNLFSSNSQTSKHSFHRIKNCWRSFDDDLLMMTTDVAQALTIHFIAPYSVHRTTSHHQWLIGARFSSFLF